MIRPHEHDRPDHDPGGFSDHHTGPRAMPEPKRKAVTWADMSAPQRFVTAVFLAGVAALFAVAVATACVKLVELW